MLLVPHKVFRTASELSSSSIQLQHISLGGHGIRAFGLTDVYRCARESIDFASS